MEGVGEAVVAPLRVALAGLREVLEGAVLQEVVGEAEA